MMIYNDDMKEMPKIGGGTYAQRSEGHHHATTSQQRLGSPLVSIIISLFSMTSNSIATCDSVMD